MVAFTTERAATISVFAELMFEMQIDQAQEDGSVVFRDDNSVRAHVIMHCTE
jgi:hypothetical protein